MGVKKGLSIDGYNYFSDILSGNKQPEWMDFSKQIAKLTGSYTMLNLATGIQGLDSFLFRTPKWPIGGLHFDGIMRTEHTSRIRPTQYPVQTGVIMTDHAVIEPAELTIEVMMSDCHTTSFVTNNTFLDTVYQSLKGLVLYSNFAQTQLSSENGNNRSIQAWIELKKLQLSRIPVTVETRLQTYENMIIEELSAPDDVKTLNALKCTVRLREIIVAYVAETKVSARTAATEQTASGQTPVQTNGLNKTMAESIIESAGKVVS